MRRMLAVLLLACSVVLGSPVQALAGGPTSVLMASPTTGHAAALYASDLDYQVLQDVLASGPAVPEPPLSDQGTAVTVTWLIHDVTVWRVDRVRLDGTSVFAATQDSPKRVANGAGPVPDEPLVWRRLTHGSQLTELFRRHGLLDHAAASPAAASPAAASASTPTPSPPAARGAEGPVGLSAAAPPAGWPATAGAGGAVLGAFGTWLVMRRRWAPRSTGPGSC
ncbi:MAG TPA: hypothetical protein VFJ97_14195 [Dermatophilaceae bacterium]|nr:hypothetical protein [Dermatophilaceae bacterium]